MFARDVIAVAQNVAGGQEVIFFYIEIASIKLKMTPATGRVKPAYTFRLVLIIHAFSGVTADL